MKPKEKAEDLIKKYEATSEKCHCLEYMCICFRMGSYKAAECALIAVEEIIQERELDLKDFTDEKEHGAAAYNKIALKYWNRVKAELKKQT